VDGQALGPLDVDVEVDVVGLLGLLGPALVGVVGGAGLDADEAGTPWPWTVDVHAVSTPTATSSTVARRAGRAGVTPRWRPMPCPPPGRRRARRSHAA
jgi:hypothetical protein